MQYIVPVIIVLLILFIFLSHEILYKNKIVQLIDKINESTQYSCVGINELDTFDILFVLFNVKTAKFESKITTIYDGGFQHSAMVIKIDGEIYLASSDIRKYKCICGSTHSGSTVTKIKDYLEQNGGKFIVYKFNQKYRNQYKTPDVFQFDHIPFPNPIYAITDPFMKLGLSGDKSLFCSGVVSKWLINSGIMIQKNNKLNNISPSDLLGFVESSSLYSGPFRLIIM